MFSKHAIEILTGPWIRCMEYETREWLVDLFICLTPLELLLSNHQWGLVAFIRGQFHMKYYTTDKNMEYL